MEVDATSYPHHLLEMLRALSEADFVSMDLELSGIPSRGFGAPRPKGRQSLEHRYAEVKAGAEKFTILQVGLTCAHFDHQRNAYVLRPYNVNISPIIDERIDFERDTCIQGGAAKFLMNHSFDLSKPFTSGVQYLSREEAEHAKALAYNRFEKKEVVEDLQLRPEDVESINFVERVRNAITTWKTNTDESLDITSDTGKPIQPAVPAISRFEKRLVHQLVRAEFPECVTMSKNTCIRIIPFDEEREANNLRKQKLRAKADIIKQTGFRWVVEAMAGGNISSIDPMYFAQNPNGMVIAADIHNLKDRFQRIQEQLRVKQPVLVGHNMFLDLVYFYHTFIGTLPNTLAEFFTAIHELFPRIIDTKWLATHTEGDLNASPDLETIAEGLSSQRFPNIVIHSKHAKYEDKARFHEAGYDSLLTATILLRLSTKLSAGDVPAPPPKPPSPPKLPTNPFSMSSLQEFIPNAGVWEMPKKTAKRLSKASKTQAQGRGAREKTTRWQDEPDTGIDKTGWVEIDKVQRHPMEIMPDFGVEWWKEMGNVLRVFGTSEGMMRIAEWA
ncbi:CAF1-domain-containing protein [Amniculicola lignicola CBS 123094]|uniref:CAF1-domain-containing protein n=1 Tax=Amniculicola lignicola CBS 123094 TaxID=1392246 RepID=A0A6A5WN05_9PLEO|nr:CAF1-domain-containing protein [Amniculicola lignicola CBS 123094]